MILEYLSGIYGKIEEKWYGFLDFLSARGIPANTYADFLEKRGLPSLPVTVALFLLLFLLLLSFLTPNTLEVSLQLSIKDDYGNALQGVYVKISTPEGKSIKTLPAAYNGITVKLSDIPLGTKLVITGSKQGYTSNFTEVEVNSKEISTELVLARELTLITARVQVFDSESKTFIATPKCYVEFEGKKINGRPIGSGLVEFVGVPANLELRLFCEASGYETVDTFVKFAQGETKKVELPPKTAELSETATILITVRDYETEKLIPGARIVITEFGTENVLADVNAENGQYVVKLPVGSVITISVSKDGYYAYSSSPITIRSDSEFPILLKKGGTSFSVRVLSEDNVQLVNVSVKLFNEALELIKEGRTDFTGTVTFEGIDTTKKYYITAYYTGFLPAFKELTPEELQTSREISIVLKRITKANSGTVTFRLKSDAGTELADAYLHLYRKIDGRNIPLGIGPLRANYKGEITVMLAPGDYVARIETPLYSAEKEFSIGAGEEKTIEIAASRIPTIKRLRFLDEEGKPVRGQAIITTPSGEKLYEGPIKEGIVEFDSKGNETVRVKVVTEDGKEFETEARLKEEETEIEVTKEKAAKGAAPKIEFLGIVDKSGNSLEGAPIGTFVWARFRILAPEADEIGVHVRVGSDTVRFAESQLVGIYGFDGKADSIAYGLSYHPPLGQATDYANAGRAGIRNKWIELTFKEPADEIIIGVKIKVERSFSKEGFELHYRAWARISDSIYRDPVDDELQTYAYTEKKHSLYAKTYKENIRVFAAYPDCEEGICIQAEFWDGEKTIKPEDFFARVGKEYMLTLTIFSHEGGKGTLKVSTTKEPESLAFSAIREPRLGFTAREMYDKTEVSAPLMLAKGQEKKLGAAFIALSEGGALISVSVELDGKKIAKDFYFNIYGPKKLSVTLSEPDVIPLGKDVKVLVEDEETKEPITDAKVVLLKNGRPIVEKVGDNTENNGKDGIYTIETSELMPGKYQLIIEAKDSEPYTKEIGIGLENVIEIDSPIEIKLRKGEREKTIIKTIRNNSEDVISDLLYEFTPSGDWPEELIIEIILPERLMPKATGTVQIIVSYTGEEEKSITATGTLTIYGTLDLLVKGSADVIVKYNEKLPEECITIEPESVYVEIIGSANQKEELTFTVKYEEKEGCEGTLRFIERLDIDDPNLELMPKEFEISPGETKQVSIYILNIIDRAEPSEKPLLGWLFFEAQSITKALKVELAFIDPVFSLRTSNNIPLYMSYNEQTGFLEGFAQLYMKNIGHKLIENIRWSVSPPPGIEIYITETPQAAQVPGAIAKGPISLAPGEELAHPLTIYAKSSNISLERGPHRAEILLSASIEGFSFEKVVTVWIFVSPAECLRITPKEDLVFVSEDASQGVLTKTILISNECGEVIRDIAIEPEYLGPNKLSLFVPAGPYIYPDQTVEAKIMLSKAGDYFNTERPDEVIVSGLLVNSQQFTRSNPLMLIAEIGLKPETAAGPGYAEITLPLCEDPESSKTVRFPMQSANADCEAAYCDALQLSTYIAEKIKETIAAVKQRIQESGSDIRNYPFCQPGARFCTFNSLGIISYPYRVYMNHDNLTAELLQHVVERTEGLSNMIVRYSTGNLEELLTTATGFTANQIYLEKPLKGCGRYYFSIEGAVQQVQGKLEKDSLIILVRVISDRAVTPECTLKVQNFLNFLPEDKELSQTSSMGTWLGMVQANENLKELGASIAEGLFGRSQGRVAQTTNSNKLKLVLEELPSGSIVEIKIDQRSTVEANPVTILLLINWYYGEGAQEIRNEIASKATYALQQIKQGSFEIQACISNDETYMKIMKLESVGELRIEHKGNLPLYYNTESCIDLNVISNIRETIALRTNWSLLNPSERAGIKEVYIKVDGKIIEEYSNEKGVEGTPIELEEVPGFKGLYKKDFQLCAIGDNGLVPQAAGKRIKVKARSLSIATKEMKEWHDVEIEVCGIHPYSLIERMKSVEVEPGEEKVFYTTLGWKGTPESISLEDIERSLKAQEIVGQLPQPGKETPVVVDRIARAYQKGWLYYLLTCVGVSMACNSLKFGPLSGIIGLFLAPWNIAQALLFDCGPPVLMGASSTTGAPGFVNRIGGFWRWVKERLPFLGRQAEPFSNVVRTEELPEELQKAIREEVIPAAIVGFEAKLGIGVTRELIRTFGDIPITEALKPSIAEKASSYVAKKFSSEMLAGSLESEIKEILKPKFMEILNAAPEKAKLSSVMTEDAVRSAWRSASKDVTEKVLENLDELSKKARITRELTKTGAKRAKEVFDPDEIAKMLKVEDILGEASKTISASDFDSEVARIAKEAKNRILKLIEFDKIKPKLGGASSAIENTIEDTIRRTIRQAATKDAAGNFIIEASNLDNAIKESIIAVNSRFADKLARAYGEEIAEKIVRETGEEIAERAPKITLMDRIKQFFSWRNLGRILRGAFCDAVANFAGYRVFVASVTSALKKLAEEGAIPSPTVEYGDIGKYYEGPAELHKYRPYKIIVGRNQYGRLYYRIEPIDTEEEFEEMKNAIASNPDAYWVDDCREYREREFKGFLGCLMPRAEKGIKADHVRAYYTDNSVFRKVSEEFSVPEALLVAFLTVDPERIEGCSITKDWYEKAEDRRVYAIRCAGEKISRALAETDKIEEIARIVGSKKGTPPDRYIQGIKAAYNLWNSFNICTTPG